MNTFHEHVQANKHVFEMHDTLRQQRKCVTWHLCYFFNRAVPQVFNRDTILLFSKSKSTE